MSHLTRDDGQPHVLALPADDDRGAAYAAAVTQSEAEFDHARRVLGEAPHQLDDVGALAVLLNALPPDMGLRIGVARIVAPGADPAAWITTVVPSIIALAGPQEPPVHDSAGRECYVFTPGLQLTEWLLPDGDESAGEPQAADLYHRLREACDHGGPARILTAASSAIASIAALLGDPIEGPLGFLSDDSAAAAAITDAIALIAAIAVDLTALATQTQAEEHERSGSAQ